MSQKRYHGFLFFAVGENRNPKAIFVVVSIHRYHSIQEMLNGSIVVYCELIQSVENLATHFIYTLFIFLLFLYFKTQLEYTLGCTSVEPETLLGIDSFNDYKPFYHY